MQLKNYKSRKADPEPGTSYYRAPFLCNILRAAMRRRGSPPGSGIKLCSLPKKNSFLILIKELAGPLG
jgi:hypothetical protein